MNNNIGQRIRYLRKQKGWTQEKLAEYAGINRVTVASYEQGKYLPSLTALEMLAKALGVSKADITGEEQKQEDNILEILHQNPRLGLLFDKSRNMDAGQIEAMLSVADAITNERGQD